jgi:phosphoserine/homoserine phosphotransferase
MHIVCSDLEGIFAPEIWINVAEMTGIEELRLTTRDISDYDVLMKHRLKILTENGLTLADIQKAIARMDPLDGASDFLDWLREKTQVIIVSDTYVEFAGPLMKKLRFPTLLCNSLSVDANGVIHNYLLRQKDGKRKVTLAFKGLNYRVIAIGDSYNDITMLQTADKGILYRPPESVRKEYSHFPVCSNFEELRRIISATLDGEEG